MALGPRTGAGDGGREFREATRFRGGNTGSNWKAEAKDDRKKERKAKRQEKRDEKLRNKK